MRIRRWQLGLATGLLAGLGLLGYLARHAGPPARRPGRVATAAPSPPTPPAASPRPAGAAPAVAAAPAPRPRLTPAARARLLAAVARARAARLAAAAPGGRGPAAAPAPAAPVAGSLDKEYLRARIRELVPLVRECYDNALQDHPDLAGRLVVEFEIAGEPGVGGVVTTSAIVGTDAGVLDASLEECVRETMYGLELEPPAGGGVVKVRYPFVFRAR